MSELFCICGFGVGISILVHTTLNVCSASFYRNSYLSCFQDAIKPTTYILSEKRRKFMTRKYLAICFFTRLLSLLFVFGFYNVSLTLYTLKRVWKWIKSRFSYGENSVRHYHNISSLDFYVRTADFAAGQWAHTRSVRILFCVFFYNLFTVRASGRVRTIHVAIAYTGSERLSRPKTYSCVKRNFFCTIL